MSLSLAQIVFDCQDAAKLAGFWSAVLERPVDAGATLYFASIGRGQQAAPAALMFLKVDEPKQVKNRVHLDLVAHEWDAERTRVTQLGAVEVAEFREYGTHWVTLRDPEGNEFDLGEA